MTFTICFPASPGQFPGLMEPSCSATPFNGSGWTFALATTGHRMLAGTGTDGSPWLRSRRGVEATRWFAEVARALAALRMPGLVLDGEVCVLDVVGRSDAQGLHARTLRPGRTSAPGALVMYLRDVLVWQGQDVRALPWRERQALLALLPLHEQPALHLQRTVRAEGVWLYRQAQALGFTAVHGYRADAPYVAGRSLAWLSISVHARALDLAA